MLSALIAVTVSLLWTTGHSLSGKVVQVSYKHFGTPGGLITVSCSHSLVGYNVISWYQQLAGHTNLDLIGHTLYKTSRPNAQYVLRFNMTGDGSEAADLHIQLRKLENRAAYYCSVKPGHPVTPPTVKVLRPSRNECRDKKDRRHKKTLVCVASGFYPDHVHVTWQINGVDVTDGVATDNAAVRDGKSYSITSRIRVLADEWHTPGKTFNCTVSFLWTNETLTYHSDSVEGIEGQVHGMTKEYYKNSAQTVKLTYLIFIAKSSFYGFFVVVLMAWKLRGSSEAMQQGLK